MLLFVRDTVRHQIRDWSPWIRFDYVSNGGFDEGKSFSVKLRNKELIWKIIFAVQLTYNTVIAVVKLSIVSFYLRLGNPTYARHWYLCLIKNLRLNRTTSYDFTDHHYISYCILHCYPNSVSVAMSSCRSQLGHIWETQKEVLQYSGLFLWYALSLWLVSIQSWWDAYQLSL